MVHPQNKEINFYFKTKTNNLRYRSVAVPPVAVSYYDLAGQIIHIWQVSQMLER